MRAVSTTFLRFISNTIVTIAILLSKKLFPSWQGNFDNSRPSLSGLDNERVISTLQRGLISEAELNSLLHLIRSPDVRDSLVIPSSNPRADYAIT